MRRPPRPSVFLVGFMAAGKSSVGRALARLSGRPFIDTDVLVSALARRTIPQLFAAEGEAGFRRREARALSRAARVPGAVVAVGGGAVTRPANVALMRGRGKVVWLVAPLKTLARRAEADGAAARPLWGKAGALLAERRPLYRGVAHFAVLSGRGTPEAVAGRVLARLGREGWR